jgi:hypothetical protein
MRTRTRIFAATLALAIAAPIAVSQGPTAPAADGTRVLPSTAASYAEYQGHVTQIMSKELGSAAELNKQVQTFGSANVNQLSSGWISYGAILAAQNPEFAESVRKADADYGRERMMLAFKNEMSYARTLGGGEAALQAALAVNAHETSRISRAGAFVREQSYTMQNVTWGKAKAVDPKKTAASLVQAAGQAKPASDAFQQAFSAPDLNVVLASLTASPTTSQSIWDKVSTLAVSSPGAAFVSISPVVAAPSVLQVTPGHEGTAHRMLNLGAQHVLMADESYADTTQATMADPISRACLESAKMQFFGCVSSATHNYTLAGCIATKALQMPKDRTESIGSCMSGITQ